MDLTTTKIVVLAVVGLIIIVALLGEFRPRSRRVRQDRRTALVPVRSGADSGAGSLAGPKIDVADRVVAGSAR